MYTYTYICDMYVFVFVCACVCVCVCVCGFSGTIDKVLTFEVTNFKVMITFL